MQTIAAPATARPATPGVSADLIDTLGSGVALAILAFIFITFTPFSDLGDPKMLEVSSGNELLTYAAGFILLGFSGALLYCRGALALSPLVTKESVLLAGWLAVSMAWSSNPSTSVKRLVITCVTLLLAAMLPWLTRGLRHFAGLLLIAAGAALALSYAGVVVAPHLTVHQATDIVEPGLAGDWRGIYAHKNVTAGVMGIFVLFGWIVARAGYRFCGVMLTIAAAAFLLGTNGKSAIGLILVAVALAFMVAHARAFWLKAVIALGPLALLGFLTVGSLINGVAHAILTALPVDSTFTGRADVWRFALDAIAANPWKGHGFEAFWYSDVVLYGAEVSTVWAGSAHTSHNGYIDLALTIGLPGLALFVAAFVLRPLRDFHNTLDVPANRDLACLFLAMLLFSLYLGMFEAYFLSRTDPMWFACAMAVCGLRYTARYAVRS